MHIPSRTAHRRRSSIAARTLGSFLAGDLTTMRLGGGGETTRFVCGYFGCERHADRLFLAGLPLMIKINIRGDPGGRVAGKLGPPPGFRGRMRAPRAVHAPVKDGGSALHRNVAALHGAIACGADRLAGGRARCGGRQRARVDAPQAIPPMDHSRIGRRGRQPRARSLRSGSRAISGSRRWPIWRAGGCNSRQDCLRRRNRRCCRWRRRSDTSSEAAFNRAFKREFGIPPGQFRKRASPPDQVDAKRKRTARLPLGVA